MPIPPPLIQIGLSHAACALALGTGGITDRGVRAAIGKVHLNRDDLLPRVILCTPRESRHLLHFYKFAAAFFAEVEHDERAHLCREAIDVITLTRQRVGIVDGRHVRS